MAFYFIGMRDEGGGYEWVDGTEVTYTNWALLPGIKACVGFTLFDLISSHGEWVTEFCTTPQHYVCEKQGESMSTYWRGVFQISHRGNVIIADASRFAKNKF